jgi:hypothetical protein
LLEGDTRVKCVSPKVEENRIFGPKLHLAIPQRLPVRRPLLRLGQALVFHRSKGALGHSRFAGIRKDKLFSDHPKQRFGIASSAILTVHHLFVESLLCRGG